MSERRGHHTHHPRCRPMCPLSRLTRHATPATLSQMPRLTSLTHMACFVWLLPSTHTHTGWLTAHTPSTHHHHWVCVCSSTCSHPPLTHTGRTGVAHAWVVAGVVTTTTPLVPHHHTHTQRDWWCGPWWCLVVRVCPVCASHATITLAFPPTTTTNALVPPPPSHTHTRDLVHAPLPHTHATCTTTHTKACCVLTTPCHTHHHPLHPPIHTHTHHMAHTHGISHTATMVLAIAHHAVHSHTQLMPHTHHTGDRPRPSTPLAVAFREPPPPRWSCPFALLSSSLLVHQTPFLSLSSMHSHAPHVLITTTMPSIPCVCWCVLWGWTAPSTTVVVKHATHTLVDHCVDGSHHPTLHPPSTLTPFCAFATTNHHAIPLLQPPHTTKPLCSSTAHSSASHTHMV